MAKTFNIELITPEKSELWFTKQMLEDPSTMDYNAGYDVNYDGYNYQDGTISKSMEEIQGDWYDYFVNNAPENFYYYIKVDNDYVGEIYAKRDDDKDAYEIGIIIKGDHRGKGYATPAIGLLCEKLKENGVKKLYHELPSTRTKAITADMNNGFIVIKEYVGDMKCFGKNEILVYLEKIL